MFRGLVSVAWNNWRAVGSLCREERREGRTVELELIKNWLASCSSSAVPYLSLNTVSTPCIRLAGCLTDIWRFTFALQAPPPCLPTLSTPTSVPNPLPPPSTLQPSLPPPKDDGRLPRSPRLDSGSSWSTCLKESWMERKPTRPRFVRSLLCCFPFFLFPFVVRS